MFYNSQTAQFLASKAQVGGMVDTFYDGLLLSIKHRYSYSRAVMDSKRVIAYHDWLTEVSPDYNWNWSHLLLVFDALEGILAGVINRLMIFMPPRHGKSEAVTVRFPVYLLEQDPTKRIILPINSVSST
jgi:hypothetical protein